MTIALFMAGVLLASAFGSLIAGRLIERCRYGRCACRAHQAYSDGKADQVASLVSDATDFAEWERSMRRPS